MSKENAQEFADSTVNEMKRVSRKNLNAGYVKVYDTETNGDKTKEILNSPLMNPNFAYIFTENGICFAKIHAKRNILSITKGIFHYYVIIVSFICE
jgi:hypothetical protein